MEIVLAIVGKITEYTIAPIGHQLGYLIHYGRNIDDLRAQVDSLRNVRVVVEGHVTAAERNGDIIRPYVKDWIDKANNIVEESDRLLDHEVNIGNQRCSLRSCPKYLVSRYKVSRKANKKKMVVDEHFDRRNKWIDPLVSDPAPPPPIRDMYHADAEDLESRKSIINDVLDAIRDDKYNVIGVHGMGGIGKTTLAKEVAKIAEEDKLFEVITPVVAVSQTPSIMKIQHEIAARLGMKLDEKENEEMRAGRLHARILKEKSILVILDDLWAELKLKDIGIPTPSVHHKGCKILLTTRSQQVCNQMGSQRAFPINVLTEGEAWKLFKENAGDDTVDSPNILPIATQVAKECAGLPLAIVLVARALMKRGQSVWEDTLHRLQNHELNSIEVKLHESLKLSYDFLREEDKSCLLLCCLAPEDSEISVIELARWGMGLRLFKNVWKWVEVRNRVRTSIDNLKACSLLLESTRQECVRMHDVVRDFAISIASESKRGIWARIDFGRSEWSDNYLLPLNNNDTTIAVLNNFHHLPAQIDCPKLNLLLLEEFDSSTELPEKLFNQMTELRVLSMVGMSIPEEKGLPWITELRGLEILRISRSSDIFVLPREIGELTRLRILDLSGCKGLRRIPAGVLSRLSQLEGLYMERCFDIKWGEDDSSASLDELKGLSNLSDLHMHLDNHNAQHFPQDIQLPMRLSEFQFHLGRRDYYLFKPNIPKTLVFEGYDAKRIASHQGFKMLLNMAEYLVLQYTEDVECFLSDVKRQGFSKLKRLEVFADSTVEYLANYTTKEGGVMILPRPKVFPVLETLQLYLMENLKEICHGQLPAGSFCELTLLNVHSCRELKKLINICSQNIANGFGQQLHEISISYCHNLEEIFTYDDDIVGVEEETNEIILLPKLRILSLQWTPNLATFCSKRSTPRTILQQHQTIFFPEKIVFSNLNKLVVSGSFEEIWPPQIPGNSFCKLTDLEIGGCDKLKIAIPSNMVQRLRNNLKRLVIRACKMMKEIVANTELGSGANQEGAHHGSSTVLEFPSLVELSIENCPKIETIVARIAEGNLDDTAQVLFNDKIVFSNLNKLVVSGSFEEIWPPQIPSNSFCRLTDLEIGGCDKLKIAIPSNMVQRLRNNLKRLVIRECEMMKGIVANTELESGANQEGAHHGSSTVLEFPSLEELSIKNCPKIETIVARIAEGNLDDTAQVLFNDKIIFPKLQTLKIINGNFEQIWSPRVEIHMEENFCILRVLEIDGCQKLKKVIPYNLAKSLHALEEMTVKNCALVEEVVHEEVGESVHGEEILFPHLRKVEIDNCGGLRHLFSHSQAKLDFSQLKELEISSCKIMKEILLQESAEEDEEDNASFLRFPQLDSLRLFDLQELTCFYHGNYSLEFPSLKNLTIEKCPKMETVAFDDDVRVNTLLNEKIIFPKLHTLKVSGNFEQIKSPRVVYRMEENFRILRVLILDGCQKLKKAIPYNLAKSLHALEEITVKNCDLVEEVVEEVEESVHGEEILFPHMRKIEIGSCGGLKHLFSHSQAKLYFMKELLLQESAEEEEEDEEDKSSFLRFPQLDSLRLFRLQELTCFYHGHYTLEFPSLKKLTIEECPKMETGAFDDDVMVNSLLNEKVLLPTLDELNIIGLKCVKEIRYRQLPAKSFRQLSILKVSGCDSLRNLLTPSIVKHLSCLRQLEISSCSSLEAVLVDANEEEQRLVLQVSDMQDKDVVFPRVHWLTLESLPNLRSFYSGGLTLEFPSFNYFYLAGCPQMQTFSSGRVVTPKLNHSTKQHLFQEKTKASLPALARLIHSNDEYDLTDACRALSYLSNDNIQAVIESGVCPRLVELLLHESPSVFIPALRTVGNIVTGNDVQTQVIIGHQALPCLLNLLSSDYEKSIKKDACRIISNITAGNRDQIQAVIEAGIITPLVQLLQNDELEIKEAAALAISNATSRSINEQIKFLVGQGCIKPLCDLLVCPDPKIVTVCLEGLENILNVGEVEKNLGNTGDVNLYAKVIDEAEGLEKIENLQMHDNNEIYEKAMKILETYWLEEEDELPLGDASQTGFHLG